MTTTVSGCLHVTKNRQVLTNPLDPMEPRGYNLYLFNMNEETDRHAYVGSVEVEAGTGIAVTSGPMSGRQPTVLMVRPDAELYIVSEEKLDCWAEHKEVIFKKIEPLCCER